ncbi:MAG: DUF7453 family protein [Chthoniobacterales bacterium]
MPCLAKEAPGTGAAFDYFQRSLAGSLRLNEAGQVQFIAHLVGVGINSTNDFAIFSGVPGALQLVAWEGQPIPGLPRAMIAKRQSL